MATKRKANKPSRVPSGSPAVNAFMDKLDHPHKAAIQALRSLVLSLDSRIKEELKWNAPSFYLEDHFATFKLRPSETIQVVLHTGAKVKEAPRPFKVSDPEKLLKWAAKDRCIVTFSSAEDAKAKRESFAAIVRSWIRQL